MAGGAVKKLHESQNHLCSTIFLLEASHPNLSLPDLQTSSILVFVSLQYNKKELERNRVSESNYVDVWSNISYFLNYLKVIFRMVLHYCTKYYLRPLKHTRPYMAIQYRNVPQKIKFWHKGLLCLSKNFFSKIFCSLCTFFVICTSFVP